MRKGTWSILWKKYQSSCRFHSQLCWSKSKGTGKQIWYYRRTKVYDQYWRAATLTGIDSHRFSQELIATPDAFCDKYASCYRSLLVLSVGSFRACPYCKSSRTIQKCCSACCGRTLCERDNMEWPLYYETCETCPEMIGKVLSPHPPCSFDWNMLYGFDFGQKAYFPSKSL